MLSFYAVLVCLQNYRNTHVPITSSNVSAYSRAGLALMQWLDTRGSGHPAVTFLELRNALEQVCLVRVIA